ncbi:TPA: hypothetical protein N0F65_001199 [Lagenidium giganteum]|uniref:Uncharacterized protein n=1 Tax=Lagenidium giganteum TaxID=4803 RepID=A0AAV2Z186_9STRA|nr:TPA: hypothetical protein N0F65_001199 [Lagenidium giganteum]
MNDALVKKKIELLEQQKAKADKLNELLNAPGGFNEISRKTCKNLEAAITASKQPGYFAYYEQPEQAKAIIRSGEVQRLQEQLVQLQKQIDQLTENIDAANAEHQHAIALMLAPPTGSTVGSPDKQSKAAPPVAANMQNLKQWLVTYGSPKQASTELYTSFTPNRKVYGGTSHYSAFKTQSSTMKKGRLTK